MRYYEASPAIAPGPQAVWAGGASWPSRDWGAGGRIAPGQKITIRSRPAPGRAFPVKVTDFEPPARLRSSGGMPSGLFRGVRTFKVSPDGIGGTACDVREENTGLLAGLTWRSMPDLGPSFGRVARGLRRRAGAGR